MRPLVPMPTDNKKGAALPESGDVTPPLPPAKFAVEYCWFNDTCILDIDYFVKTLAGIKAKGVRPDLIGSIISHYASKWLPDLSSGDRQENSTTASPESATISWMKKRFFVETLVGVLPPEKDSVSCNFLLRLLRTANMVAAAPAYRAELEKRVAWQLDQASLKELMIPAFSHTCATLLDVELVLRLVRRFVGMDEAARGGAAVVKVAKLVDCYMAEVALDGNLVLEEFMALAGALPGHARATDDGLYRAIDTYLKAHPATSKPERKALCRMIDCRKLSPEAALHAAHNERLPVRAVIQVLFSQQAKAVNPHLDWSGSIGGGGRSPGLGLGHDLATRSLSKREVTEKLAQQTEMRRLREEVARLHILCHSLQAQMEKQQPDKRKSFFRWRKMGTSSVRLASNYGERVDGCGAETPIVVKVKPAATKTPGGWRSSLS